MTMIATNDWIGDLSVRKGEHLNVLDEEKIVWWKVQVAQTLEEGYVLSEILNDCQKHSKGGNRCVFAKENFDAQLYLRFEKGEHLELQPNKPYKENWIYVKSKVTAQEGYVHERWVAKPSQYIGLAMLTIFGAMLSGSDIITDMLNGADYINGTAMPSNLTERRCDDLDLYSHPAWGIAAIGLTWSPAMPIFVLSLINFFKSICTGKSPNMRGKYLLRILICLFWPLASMLM